MKDALGRPQSALILGATSDIARAIDRLLVQNGTRRFILAGRDPARLAEAATELENAGASEVRTLPFDVLDRSSLEEAAQSAFSGGDVDLAVVAFGILGDQMHDEADPQAARRVLETNCTAAAVAGLTLARRLEAQGHGTLVLLSSVAGERIRRSNFIYGAAKAGADAVYQGLAASLSASPVQVLIVRPGFVRSRMTAGMKAAPFATDPEGVAAATLEGMRNGREVVWVPGVLRYLMTVLRHLPTPLFRRLPL
jgi:decaprenylphospho-beta-D-erythro-pentofuranosid-2-ulose 2-reductase